MRHKTIRNSLAFRLAWSFAVVITISLSAVLFVYYLILESSLVGQLDTSLKNEVGEYSALLGSRGFIVLKEVLEREAKSEGTDRMFIRLLDPQGSVISTTDMRAWPGYRFAPERLAAVRTGRTVFETLDGTRFGPRTRVMTSAISSSVILQMGESMKANESILATFRSAFGTGVFAILVCSIVLGWVLLSRVLRRVEQVTNAAATIASGDLSQRVALAGRNDEIDDLARTFNQMIEHNQTLIRNLKEVTDDIAHDLRSPVTRIRGTAEVALHGTEISIVSTGVLGSIVEDCDALLALIKTMLEISETEAGLARFSTAEVNFGALVEDVCEFFSPAAEDKGLKLQFGVSGNVFVHGDAARLRRAFAQLIDNSIKYTDSGGRIAVSCARNGAWVVVSVVDSGVGIAEKDLQEIFSRFYRADQSRSQPGNGLGLSLAQAIVKAHGGTITAKSKVGEGSTFEIALPGLTK